MTVRKACHFSSPLHGGSHKKSITCHQLSGVKKLHVSPQLIPLNVPWIFRDISCGECSIRGISCGDSVV